LNRRPAPAAAATSSFADLSPSPRSLIGSEPRRQRKEGK
jgi:hypothetical protein